jgi:hypothetical protein
MKRVSQHIESLGMKPEFKIFYDDESWKSFISANAQEPSENKALIVYTDGVIRQYAPGDDAAGEVFEVFSYPCWDVVIECSSMNVRVRGKGTAEMIKLLEA